jgi:ubiquitin-conjugating enzyme E2 M
MNSLMKMNKNVRSQKKTKTASTNKSGQTCEHLIRLTNDWNDWNEISSVTINFPDVKKIDHCIVAIKPNDGYWKDATIKFDLSITSNYPHEAPKVICLSTPLYHPNINFHGNVCLNILREGWKPVMSVTDIIHGLLLLLDSPNPQDPLPNKDISPELEPHYLMLKDINKFEEMVKKTLHGGQVEELNRNFPRLYV